MAVIKLTIHAFLADIGEQTPHKLVAIFTHL